MPSDGLCNLSTTTSVLLPGVYMVVAEPHVTDKAGK
jgi:hypothetical protein